MKLRKLDMETQKALCRVINYISALVVMNEVFDTVADCGGTMAQRPNQNHLL